jgi:hypothetical protein
MARNALVAELRTADSSKMQELKARADRALEGRAQLSAQRGASDAPIVATVVFSRGLGVPELATLLRSGAFDLVSAQVMFPSTSPGVIHTVNVGAEDLAMLEGPLESRLMKAIGHVQWRFLEAAKKLPASSAERADFISVATTPPPQMRAYKIVLSGTARELQTLRRDERAALIDAGNGEQRQEELAQLRERIATQKQAGRRAPEIGMRGTPPERTEGKELVR